MPFVMRRRTGPLLALLAWIAILAAAATTAPAPAADPIPPDGFEKLHAVIVPDSGEDEWAQIPWRTSLWEARLEAARAGKPILLWEMDGHPLGCT